MMQLSSICLLLAVAAAPPEKLPAGISLVAVEAFPREVELTHRQDSAQILLTGRTKDGQTLDVTRMATVRNDAGVVSVSSKGRLAPTANGNAEIELSVGGQKARVVVKVTGCDADRPVSFVQDVQPVLSKLGCNAGTCHGSANGRNGFKLSLRGYDPLFDHAAFTDDVAARRINRVAPDQSLMLLKATGSVPHVGGVRTTPDHPYYAIVRNWIAQGLKLDLDAPRVAKIELFPENPAVPLPGMKQQMIVWATYTDGTRRDVTRDAFIESGDIERLEADPQGLIATLRRGEAPVLARYEGAYAATTITIMGDRTGYAWKAPPQYNYIDEKIDAKLQRVKVVPSELCTDEEFVRRVYLDLTGLPPTSDEVRAFLADSRGSKEKRDALVDSLVGSREFVEHWTNKWADLLQVNRKFLGEEGAASFRNWIKHNVATNRPYHEFAHELLTARGSNIANPPASYWKIFDDPADAMENTTHLFLAVRFNCNKCHDHPFERWTQDQYYHLTAFFAQVGRKEDPIYAGQKIGGSAVMGAKPMVEILFDKTSGETTHQRTGQQAPPQFPFEVENLEPGEGARRAQLARWITAPENRYFARSYVNRLWGYLFGRGIIEPIDDIRAGNPPTNPELLDALTDDFISSGFDMQHMLRAICKSRTYQLSFRTNEWNADDEVNFARAVPRRLPAEALYDAIFVATGAKQRIAGLPSGMRAAEATDSDPFLDDFGRPVRESACECERSSGVVLGPVIKLISGPTVGDALSDSNNDLARLVARESDDRKVIEEVFLRFLARRPTEQEITLGLSALRPGDAEKTAAEQALADYQAILPAKLADWEKSAAQETVWQTLSPAEMKSEAGAEMKVQEDQSILVSGKLAKDVYTLAFDTELKGITGLRIEALADPSLGSGGPGRAQNGNFVLSQLKLAAAPQSDAGKSQAVALAAAAADFSQTSWNVAGAIDGNDSTGWGIHPEAGKSHFATFETTSDIGHDGGTRLTLTLRHQYPDGQHNIGRVRVSVTTSPRPFVRGKLPEKIAAIVVIPAGERNDAQRAELLAWFEQQDARLAELREELNKATAASGNQRLIGVQDLAWALINSPAFLFNR